MHHFAIYYLSRPYNPSFFKGGTDIGKQVTFKFLQFIVSCHYIALSKLQGFIKKFVRKKACYFNTMSRIVSSKQFQQQIFTLNFIFETFIFFTEVNQFRTGWGMRVLCTQRLKIKSSCKIKIQTIFRDYFLGQLFNP